jgi:hypothetical protein
MRPSGTFDQLIVAMSIHLAHVHGQSNVALLTTDSRLAALVRKCRKPIRPRTVQKLKLARAQDVAGKTFGPDIFPEAIHLEKCSEATLTRMLGAWPLPVGRVRSVSRFDADARPASVRRPASRRQPPTLRALAAG